MQLTIDMFGHPGPKRGDIVQTNVGNRRERTCLVLHSTQLRRRDRFKVWCERWWDLEPEFRMRLFRSAERNGGQRVICFQRYRRKSIHRRPRFLAL